MWDLVKRLVESVIRPIWGRLLKLPWLARLSILIVILTVSGLFYYPAQVSYTFTLIDVPFPGAHDTDALGINARGQIVGNYSDSTGGHGFLYDEGVFTPIDVPFPGAFDNRACGINDHGQIVGRYIGSSGTTPYGFLDDKGVFTTIDVPFPGAHLSEAYGINDHGQIVGRYFASHAWHGFLYDKGVFTPLDVPFPDAFDTAAFGINDHGQIVGHYLGSTGGGGFLYDKGVFTPINVPGAIYTTASGINDHGQIVGTYGGEWEKGSRPHGFLFLYDKGVFTSIDVPFPGADYRRVSGINARGQIVGNYYNESGTGHSFLATPHKKGWLWASFIAVLLLATIGLLVLWRVRLSVSPAEAARGEPAVAEHSAWAAGRAEPSERYARLVRQSPIDTVPQEIVFDQEELLIGSGQSVTSFFAILRSLLSTRG